MLKLTSLTTKSSYFSNETFSWRSVCSVPLTGIYRTMWGKNGPFLLSFVYYKDGANLRKDVRGVCVLSQIRVDFYSLWDQIYYNQKQHTWQKPFSDNVDKLWVRGTQNHTLSYFLLPKEQRQNWIIGLLGFYNIKLLGFSGWPRR